MSTTQSLRSIARPFYVAMSVMLAAIVVFGFSHTVPNAPSPSRSLDR